MLPPNFPTSVEIILLNFFQATQFSRCIFLFFHNIEHYYTELHS